MDFNSRLRDIKSKMFHGKKVVLYPTFAISKDNVCAISCEIAEHESGNHRNCGGRISTDNLHGSPSPDFLMISALRAGLRMTFDLGVSEIKVFCKDEFVLLVSDFLKSRNIIDMMNSKEFSGTISISSEKSRSNDVFLDRAFVSALVSAGIRKSTKELRDKVKDSGKRNPLRWGTLHELAAEMNAAEVEVVRLLGALGFIRKIDKHPTEDAISGGWARLDKHRPFMSLWNISRILDVREDVKHPAR